MNPLIYTDIVQRELLDDKQNINYLTADGVKFAHPLHHLQKSKEDLPLIAIDSFRHMYLFPKTEEMEVPGKLKQFLQDLYSGKLHREFHYGPDKVTSEEPNKSQDDAKQEEMKLRESVNEINDPGQDKGRVKRENVGDPKKPKKATPPPSQFQHLGPSKNRYTLLHDEFLGLSISFSSHQKIILHSFFYVSFRKPFFF